MLQLFILNNVFVDAAGRVFNRTHLFDHNACSVPSGTPGVYHANTTKVRRFPQLISLASAHPLTPPPAALYSFLPLLFSLRATLSALPGVPFVLRGDPTQGSIGMASLSGTGSGIGAGGKSDSYSKSNFVRGANSDRNSNSNSRTNSGSDVARGASEASIGPSKADLESLRLMLSPDVLGLGMDDVSVKYIGPDELFFAGANPL